MSQADQPKPFYISKHLVMEAWKRVKKSGGGPGIDEQTLEAFERKRGGNLYKIWNRMSSGSYQPPAVKVVNIPKHSGGSRKLGIPTVSDRVAQMVVKMLLEPDMDKLFHEDSYAYRPAKSAHDAIGKARVRCWQMDWVIDLDIKGFFDNIPHDLMLKAVRKHTGEKWIILYIERWLKAPASTEGRLEERCKGTPQGGVISPLLANLFLHYAFDRWMGTYHPGNLFERYADDAVIHCTGRQQAEMLLEQIEERLGECGLQLNRAKTQIVYCKDANRPEEHTNVKFTFLGYEFRARTARNRRGQFFDSFLPAIDPRACKAIRTKIRSWHFQRRSDKSIEDLARMFEAQLSGWINYYGKYCRSALYGVFRTLDHAIVRWACRKYKKLRNHRTRAFHWLRRLRENAPHLWAHWRIPRQGRVGCRVGAV